MMCLWNVWTAPLPTSSVVATTSTQMPLSATSTTTEYTVYDSASTVDHISEAPVSIQQVQQPTALAAPTSMQPIPASLVQSNAPKTNIPNGMTLFPVHTAANGQKFIVLAPERARKESRPQNQERLDASTEFGTETEKPKEQRESSNMKTKQVDTNRRSLSAPLFVDTVTYETLSSLSSSGGTRYARHHYRPIWSSWLCGIAMSGSVLAGGLFAKRVLKRMDRWEQLSKEDSLAFDVAYTSPYKDDGDSFGSFAATSDWSGDSLDRFDV